MTQPVKEKSKLADTTDKPQIADQQAAITDAPAGGTGATAGAYDTAAHRDAMIVSVNSMLAAMRAHGLIAD